MQGRADGDWDMAKGRASKKRDLDALRAGLGAASPDAKRRHAAGGPGSHDGGGGTSNNSSSFRSSRQDGKIYSPSKRSKSRLDTLLKTQHFSRPPNTTGSAAQSSGAPGGSRGAKPGLLEGVFSGLDRRPWEQSPRRTSASTSSDASSIPAGSTGTSLDALRHGHKPADRTAAGGSRPQSKDKHGHQEIPPASHETGLEWRRRRPRHISSSSNVGFYVEGDGGSGDVNDDSDDEDAAPSPNTRQGSALPRPRGGGGLQGQHEAKPASYDKTPSGKDYHEFRYKNWQRCSAKFALFPDGYSVQGILGVETVHFVCAVRTCPKKYETLKKLDRHFKMAHRRCEFNDNLDKEGTLELIRQRRDSIPGKESIIVSQTFRPPPVPTNRPSSSHQRAKKHGPVEAAAIATATATATATAKSAGSNGFQAVTVNRVSKYSPGLQPDSSSSAGDEEQGSTSTTPSELDRAMAVSKVWAYVATLVPQTWAVFITAGPETSAFIQAISLPLRNNMDGEWLAGIKNSHQKKYRAVMSVIFQVIGVEALCKPCESRKSEKRRNCKVLPPEAAGMRELQEVYGSQCVNCYFFHAAKPCQLPAPSTAFKQTPIPVPTRPVMRPPPDTRRSLAAPPIARPRTTLAASRPQAPSYSSYRATKADKPVSESPVPIPLFAARGKNSQRLLSHTSDASSEKPAPEALRQSRRVSNKDGGSGVGSSAHGSYDTDEAESHSAASDASDAGPSKAALASGVLASGGQSNKESTAAASDLSSGQPSSSQLVGRAFGLFGDISRLPTKEQAALWNQMQQMAGILQAGAATTASTTKSTSPYLRLSDSPVAAGWEIAPGRITVDNRHLALSTSFLSREVVSLKAAQQLSPTQRVLNKNIAALNQLTVGREEGWDCTCSVVRGVLKMKAGDVDARIGQGGVIVVERECIITNVSHKEARIQVWWRKAGD